MSSASKLANKTVTIEFVYQEDFPVKLEYRRNLYNEDTADIRMAIYGLDENSDRPEVRDAFIHFNDEICRLVASWDITADAKDEQGNIIMENDEPKQIPFPITPDAIKAGLPLDLRIEIMREMGKANGTSSSSPSAATS